MSQRITDMDIIVRLAEILAGQKDLIDSLQYGVSAKQDVIDSNRRSVAEIANALRLEVGLPLDVYLGRIKEWQDQLNEYDALLLKIREALDIPYHHHDDAILICIKELFSDD